MTKPMMDLRALVEKSADADLLREMVDPCGRRFAAERLMELEVGPRLALTTARRAASAWRSATAIATGTGRRVPEAWNTVVAEATVEAFAPIDAEENALIFQH